MFATARRWLQSLWPENAQLASASIEIKLGWFAIAIFFGVFLFWAALAPMDAASVGSGVIAVSGNRQVVQHKDGGAVASLNVREGQYVKRGELLVKLAGGDVEALERSLAAQVVDLQAQQARLQAEGVDRTIQRPSEFTGLDPDSEHAANAAIDLQSQELSARRKALGDQKKIIAHQIDQLKAREKGLEDQIASDQTQDQITNDQLNGLRMLAARGFASQNRVRDLERAAAALEGDRARLQSEVAETREQMDPAQTQSLSLDSQNQKEVSDDLRTTNFTLNDLMPKLAAARDELAKTEIRAPVDGRIVGLTISSKGAVVEPGQKILEIVPDRAQLVIDARFAPREASDLQVGQACKVKLLTVQNRRVSPLKGSITWVSADSFEDQKTGAHFYTAQVEIPKSEFDIIRRADDGVKPGLPVDIMVSRRKRTLLEYLLEPLNQALWKTFRES